MKMEKTVSFPHITPGSFIGFNMQHLRLSGKHHLKLTAKTQNPTHTYIRRYSETNKTKGYQSSLLFFPQVYLARKGNKHLLSFKLVRSDYICNRYNFVPVDWQEILGHILGREKTVPEVVSSVWDAGLQLSSQTALLLPLSDLTAPSSATAVAEHLPAGVTVTNSPFFPAGDGKHHF